MEPDNNNIRIRHVTERGESQPSGPPSPSLSSYSSVYQQLVRAERAYQLYEPKSLAGIATRAFGLGFGFCAGIAGVALLAPLSPLWRLPFFLAALSAFHFLEFWATAAFNTARAETGSFLLTANWPYYALAHVTACVECLVGAVFFPRSPVFFVVTAFLPPSMQSQLANTTTTTTSWTITLFGLVLVVTGQIVRTAAMSEAGPAFHHHVQRYRAPDHRLVTTGIYAALRHPSYFGFFWWALGTQVVLGNAVCLALYAAVLWRFFRARVRGEEEALVRFFGDEYREYRARVGTGIPFIK